jgi:hypothetical protein
MPETYLLHKGYSSKSRKQNKEYVNAYLHEMLYSDKIPHFFTECNFIMIHRINYK